MHNPIKANNMIVFINSSYYEIDIYSEFIILGSFS